jgi:hypothetical protein
MKVKPRRDTKERKYIQFKRKEKVFISIEERLKFQFCLILTSKHLTMKLYALAISFSLCLTRFTHQAEEKREKKINKQYEECCVDDGTKQVSKGLWEAE